MPYVYVLYLLNFDIYQKQMPYMDLEWHLVRGKRLQKAVPKYSCL